MDKSKHGADILRSKYNRKRKYNIGKWAIRVRPDNLRDKRADDPDYTFSSKPSPLPSISFRNGIGFWASISGLPDIRNEREDKLPGSPRKRIHSYCQASRRQYLHIFRQCSRSAIRHYKRPGPGSRAGLERIPDSPTEPPERPSRLIHNRNAGE